MEVILIKDYPTLGYEGDVCKVKNGFARNYLFPRKIAIAATKPNLRMYEELKANLEKKRAKRTEEALKLKEKIEGIEISITEKVGEGGKLYGSVNASRIADELNAKGFEVFKKDVVLEQPIKEPGVYKIEVKVYKGVSAEVKVWITKEGGSKKEESPKPEVEETKTQPEDVTETEESTEETV